jgi:hypothetical protein
MNPVETTGRLAGSARSLLAAPEHVQIAKLQKELAVALQRIEELEAEKRVKAEMSFRSPFWFRDSDPCPFCTLCWEVREKLVHLEAPFEHTYGGFGYACRSCGADYRVEKLLPGTAVVPVTASSYPEVASVPRSSSVRDLFRDGW